LILQATPYKLVCHQDPSQVGENGEALCGRIDRMRQEIIVYAAPRWEETLKTILHEVFHDIRLSNHISLKNEVQEEATVDIMSNSFADFLIRNGWLK
jgi:hypothetical protein